MKAHFSLLQNIVQNHGAQAVLHDVKNSVILEIFSACRSVWNHQPLLRADQRHFVPREIVMLLDVLMLLLPGGTGKNPPPYMDPVFHIHLEWPLMASEISDGFCPPSQSISSKPKKAESPLPSAKNDSALFLLLGQTKILTALRLEEQFPPKLNSAPFPAASPAGEYSL